METNVKRGNGKTLTIKSRITRTVILLNVMMLGSKGPSRPVII